MRYALFSIDFLTILYSALPLACYTVTYKYTTTASPLCRQLIRLLLTIHLQIPRRPRIRSRLSSRPVCAFNTPIPQGIVYDIICPRSRKLGIKQILPPNFNHHILCLLHLPFLPLPLPLRYNPTTISLRSQIPQNDRHIRNTIRLLIHEFPPSVLLTQRLKFQLPILVLDFLNHVRGIPARFVQTTQLPQFLEGCETEGAVAGGEGDGG
jgi:hypothetical protein